MKIKLNYCLAFKDILSFTHIPSPRLSVTVDTDLIETVDDLKARIVDEVLRNYGICITQFSESAVPHWSDIKRTAVGAICRRRYDAAMARVRHYTEVRKEIDVLVAKAERMAEELRLKLARLSEGL